MAASGGDETQVGIVKFYNPRKGYGFVTRLDGHDVFFHLTHFRTLTNPQPGSVVRFLLGQNREGLTAEDIVVVSTEEVDSYAGVVTHLDPEGGRVTTPDNFEIVFSRSDYIPHTAAETLRVGDEVEMNFLVQDEDSLWRAKVVRDPHYQPEAQPAVARPERREGDEEEENRRLLGILYKTDLDEEASHAAQVLTERNMRATLSALVSRVFDRRLSREVRGGLVERIPRIYFDDECMVFLEQIAQQLAAALAEEDDERSPAAAEALRLLLDEDAFPVRWSQYLLPFGLSLLRNLSSVPSCHSLLTEGAAAAAAEQWLMRVCRHVEQRRSGHGYVLTTALATFDEMWQREALQGTLQRVLARLVVALDAEGLANQIYHLRDKVSAAFLPVLLPVLSQHPDLSAALHGPAQSEIFSQWIETLLRASGDTLTTETLATVLPLVEEVRANLTDEATITRLLRPVTESLTPDEVVRLLTSEDLPERAVWACLRHLDHRGELAGLLGDPEMRGLVTNWLRRTSERATPALPREQEVTTALKLLDSLKSSQELRGELAGIGESLFSGLHERVAVAGSEELVRLLDQFDVGSLPGLTAALARRLTDDRLDEPARRRLLTYFQELGTPLGEAAAALLAWHRQADDLGLLSDAINGAEACARQSDPEVASFTNVVHDELSRREIGWHDGFVAALETLPTGAPAARLEGFAILLPQRLFADPTDFAPNRFVRLLHRRGLALGVVQAAVPETDYVCGRLAGPLAIDERNAIVGTLLDADGELCYFEVAQMRSGQEVALQEGTLMRFTRVPAVGEQVCRYVAFNIHATFGPDDLPLLLTALAGAGDEGVALAAGERAIAVADLADPAAFVAGWAEVGEDRRRQLMERLDATGRQRLTALAG